MKKWVVLFLLLSCPVMASDTLRNITEFMNLSYQNLLVADTTNGNALLPAGAMKKFVRLTVLDVNAKVGAPQSKKLATVAGTQSYLVDAGLRYVNNVELIRNKFSRPIKITHPDQAYKEYLANAGVYDTAAYAFCWFHGDSMSLFPVPVRADTIALDYMVRLAHPSTDTGTVLLPVEMYQAIEYGATARGARVLLLATSTDWQTLYDREVALLRNEYWAITGMEPKP